MSITNKMIAGSLTLLSRPRVTEKATFVAGAKSPVYTFEVSPKATKVAISQEIVTKYKVKPVKVNIVNLPAKRVFVRGRRGQTAAVKKAFVFLKPGDKIDLV